MSVKIIFLDFDGVMNSAAWFKKNHEAIKASSGFTFRDAAELDPELVARVKRIVDETGASLVISSTWRILHTLEELLEILGLAGWTDAPIIDKTPRNRDMSGCRGDEVAAWLKRHPGVTKWVALDDDSDFLEGQMLVQTSWTDGIQESDVIKAINILGRKDEHSTATCT